MDEIEFMDIIKKEALLLDITINEEQANNFYKYMNLLIEWNKKINLTAITEPEEIIKKHFIDSITLLPDINCFMRKL